MFLGCLDPKEGREECWCLTTGPLRGQSPHHTASEPQRDSCSIQRLFIDSEILMAFKPTFAYFFFYLRRCQIIKSIIKSVSECYTDIYLIVENIQICISLQKTLKTQRYM